MDEMTTMDYGRLAKMVMDAGALMIQSGAETHRVEDTMLRMLSTSKLEIYTVTVLRTTISLTLSDPSIRTISLSRRAFSGEVNLGLVSDINNISREFCNGLIDLDEAERKVNSAKTTKTYSSLIRMLGIIFGCAGFSVVFGGKHFEILVSLFGGLILALTELGLRKMRIVGFLNNLFSAFVSTVGEFAIVLALYKLFGIENISLGSIIAGCIMPLVPGLAITTAARDLFGGDYLSSISRIMEAILCSVSIALGAGAGIAVGMLFNTASVNFGGGGVNFLECAFAFVATLGFAFLFHVPKRKTFLFSLCGAISWATYVLCYEVLMFDAIISTFVATIVASTFSHIFARSFKSPVIVYLIGGIIILVPGFHIYRAAYLYIIGQSAEAGKELSVTLLMAGSIALAIFVVDSFVELIRKKPRTLNK